MYFSLSRYFSVVTIFFAVKLTKAELPKWFDWILVAFVGFHVVIHVVLSVSSAECPILTGNFKERIIQKQNNCEIINIGRIIFVN